VSFNPSRALPVVSLCLAALLAAGCTSTTTSPGGGGNPTRGWFAQGSGVVNDLLGVAFADTLHGWAVGDRAVLHTSDGGQTWVSQTQNAGAITLFRAASAVDSAHCWVVGDDGSVRATADGGATWVRQLPLGASGYLESVRFVDANRGWACGRLAGGVGVILYTLTGGQIWNQVDLAGAPELKSIDMAASGYGVVCGTLGAIYYTRNAGLTWTRATSNTTVQLQAVAVDAGGGDALCGGLIGLGGVLKSTDGGQSWTTGQPLPSNMEVRGASVPSFTDGWVVGTSAAAGQIARTPDGGITWAWQSISGAYALNAISTPDPLHGWAVGDHGTIFRTVTGGD